MLIARGTTVTFGVRSEAVVRLIQVVGTLSFIRDCDTELNVGLLTVQRSDACSEHGFACEFEGADQRPETPDSQWPTLRVGTLEQPIPAQHAARNRLHYLEGMIREDAPALACCSERMELHGSPLSFNWTKLNADVRAGDRRLTLAEAVTGWRLGDEVIVTGSEQQVYGAFQPGPGQDQQPQTEQRRILSIDGRRPSGDTPSSGDVSVPR